MSTERVTKLLKNYRAYRFAVSQYERHNPQDRTDALPTLIPSRMIDTGLLAHDDYQTYTAYANAVRSIEGALETLTDDQRSVVRLKWMDDVPLCDIAIRKHMSERTVRRIHKIAMSLLAICIRFEEAPEIDSGFSARISQGRQAVGHTDMGAFFKNSYKNRMAAK